MIIDNLKVIKASELAPDIYDITFARNESGEHIVPGQFLNVYPKNEMLSLPRPISICESTDETIRIVFQRVGKGTEEFSKAAVGDFYKVLYPLGNGYRLHESGKHVIIAGGIGTPPMLQLAKQLQGDISVYLGFKANPILADEFKAITYKVYIATETGDCGEKGNVIDLLDKYDSGGDNYYACGPVPMLKAASGYLASKGKTGQLSLEQRMACGFGACVGCAVKIMKDDGGWHYLKACTDGPVFENGVIVWE